ncbi:MAG: penicillin-binding protein 2 [Actinobacteria bacterium]|jgi:peptidoglycan glycosyltransferase|nr:penicillin-binding protein 2 [Actinomycetota bacterium]
MQRQITRVGITIMVMLLIVFAQLNYLQIFAADSIASNPANSRRLLQEYSIKRGNIITSDNVTIAESTDTGGRFRFERSYPEEDLFGHTTGFYSILFGNSGIESAYGDELLGESNVISMQDIEDSLFGSGEQGDNVRVTINSEMQQVARDALGEQRGSVVAMDPRSGQILAMWNNPSFDPTPLASHESEVQRQGRAALDPQSATSPLVNLATQRGYPPGSTFKVVTAAAALESGEFNPGSTFDDPVSFDLPQTDDTISNFSGGACTGGGQITLEQALTVSCNTTFAEIGQEIPDEIAATSEAFGFNSALPFDLRTEQSTFQEADEDNLPRRSLSAIGQGDVVATPLQMLLVVAAIANDGEVPRPRLAQEIVDPTGGVVESFSPETLGEAMSTSTSNTLGGMMRNVVENGSGTAAQIPGVVVAGKTGTAQTTEGADPHAWFISFAGPDGDDPQIAVAVIVENGGSLGSEATGGQVAAPIAKALIETDKAIRGW